ncbi:MAG: hypothetical protein ACREJD_08180 [Phycisphaerales bacterium]
MNSTASNLLKRMREASRTLLRSRRRGSFLVLVVGTLAMLSIIMIVYVTVGNSDKRASRSLERRNRSDEVISLFSDYVAQIIADDAVAVAPDPSNSKADGTPSGLTGGNLYIREAWDIPSTNWRVSSSVVPGTTLEPAKVFRTVGVGDDPWLASTTPTWINYNPASSAPTYSGKDGDKKNFAKRRDWLHISNVAPDGRFVNLYNLYNNFDARPGTLETSGDEHMNGNLSLTDQNGAVLNVSPPWGTPVGTATSSTSDYQNPSTFDSWQVGAFRPARGPFLDGGQDILTKPLTAKYYPPYQWADADGDGFLDSRWFEMVDARDTGNSTNVDSPQFFRNLLPTDPNYRWFFATRVIDLSALVNVNTAGDGNADPNNTTGWSTNPAAQPGVKGSVMGQTPTDIDLRRLLTLRDSTESVFDGSTVVDNVMIDSKPYAGGYSSLVAPIGGNPVSQDYTLYDDKPLAALTPKRPYGITQDLGWGAYESLRASVNLGRPPGRFARFYAAPLLVARKSFETIGARQDFYKRAAPSVARPAYRALDATRGDLTDTKMSGSGGFVIPITGATDFGLGFRLNNLIELLTFRSVNDPNVSSSLESALGGRKQSNFEIHAKATDVTDPAPTFGPLRENRSLELERENLAYTTGANIGQPTEAAMLRSYIDVRQYLTTLSGARPIIAANTSVTNVDNPPALSSTDISTYVPENPTAASLFSTYVTALLPGLPFYVPSGGAGTPVEIWKDIKSDQNSKELRGMFYGGQGPMTALLAAGHMAANFASGAQSQDDTTVSNAPYVLVLAEPTYKDAGVSLPSDTALYTDWKKYFPSWWSNGDHRLNIARLDQTNKNGAKLSVDKAPPIPAPAVNIYGMGNPHPFLVEVASFTVYRDTPLVAGGRNFPGADFELTPSAPAPFPEVTIDGNIIKGNPDLMFRVFAVKLHNPYTIPIVLSSGSAEFGTAFDTTSGSQFTANAVTNFSYIQAGLGTFAKYFVLANVTEEKTGTEYSGKYHVDPVTILPNETILFYALNQDAKGIVEDRFNATDKDANGDPKSATLLENWLELQLGKESDKNFRRIKMLRVDGVFDDKAPAASKASFQFDTLIPKYDSDQTVMLMRSVRLDSDTTLGNDSAAGSFNTIWNDQLCDRLRLKQNPSAATQLVLDQQLKPKGGGGGNVLGMYVDPSDTKQDPNATRPTLSDGTPNYNTRFTVTLAADVRRKGDEEGATLVAGQLPAWAIDPKDSNPDNWYVHKTYPVDASTAPYQLKLTMVSADLNLGNGALYSGRNPKEWRLLTNPTFPTLKQPVGSWSDKVDPNKAGTAFKDLRRELSFNANKYQGYKTDYTPSGTTQIRPTDLLNVLAVGSSHVPVDVSGVELVNGTEPDLTKQWTTTAEALAIAMGYGDRKNFDYVGGKKDYGPLDYYYFDLATQDDTKVKPLFDSGYLRLDDFVAVRYDTNDKPYTAGTGAPIAGNILSMFRVHPDAFASLNIATPGVVNVNTAPQAVLRVLPFTFPSTNEYIDFAPEAKQSGRAPSTFWAGDVEATRATAALQTDIAAMIESYRDKIGVELRPKAKNLGGGDAKAPTWFAGFFDRSSEKFNDASTQVVAPNVNTIGDYPATPATAGTYNGGRYWSTGLRGIREGAGFQSIGELLAVRQVDFDPATNVVNTSPANLALRTSNIDSLAYLTKATNMLGTDSIVERVLDVTDPTKPKTTDLKPLQFPHTYQDKLKVLSGMLGSISVRSDMYAVWFVARGYQRSDVEGLPAGQPMVPSIERRFLMIIDRSNVTKVGQKPRVLAFVELPL